MHMFGFGGWGVLLFGFGFFALLLIGLIIFVVWAVRQGKANQAQDGSQSTPEQILKVRYARGEITRKEYQSMMADINDNS
ncbi:MAG: SHOCT domain-containing protein [Anaerolineales bacterium]|jgi:putative membrane protein